MFGGGALRSASILEYLLPRYETDVFCFVQNDSANNPPSGSEFRPPGVGRWTNQPLPFHSKTTLPRALRNASRVLRHVPPLVDRFAGFDDALCAAIAGQRYDVAIVEHFWCASYAEILRPVCDRLVIDLHNIESIWHKRSAAEGGPVARTIHMQFARAAARLEKHLLPQFDLALVTSKPDGDFLRTHFPQLSVRVVKNTMPVQPQPAVMREDVIVFSGYMDYVPNETAVLDFASHIWPIVSKMRPDTRWKIVGKSANKFEKVLADVPRICLVSDPEDAMIEIASASVAVVPLRVGSGTRLKIVEAWAAGTPVVSTTLGAEGLECEPERDLLIADVSEEFAKKVIDLLEDARFAREIGANGRSRFEAAYTWQTAWDELTACNL
jgi:hypothetical protein